MRNHKNLLPNIILFVTFFLFIVYIFSSIKAVALELELSEVQTSLQSTSNSGVVYGDFISTKPAVKLSPTEDREELLELIEIYRLKREAAHSIIESARALGYNSDDSIICFAKIEATNASEGLFYYQKLYNELGYSELDEKAKEYPSATYIWIYLKDKGYNDYVCAGIMGNIMAEVGGQTLALNIYADTSSHYGICQWSKVYYKGVQGAGLEAQCKYLCDTMEEQFNTYGFIYKRNFDYSDFLALANEKDAALAFAEVYERCGSASYNVRQKNATAALEYFVN